MKKWTYLVAALLLMGTTTTFTGCIDNDEPAGITDLRGAKAELIRANVAYRLAEAEIKKVDIERQRVLLEREKIDMELQKLDLKIKEASSAHDIAYWEQAKALMIEEYKAKLFQYQANSANWEAAYLKALADLRAVQATITDKTFAAELGKLIADLEGERSNIKELNNDLFDLTQDLLAFASNKYEAIKGVAEKDMKNKESKLVNQNAILEEVKSLKADFGTEAINAQILDLEKKIAKIDEEVATKKADLIKVVGSVTPNQQLFSKQEVALETADKVVAFEVPSAIQDKFITDFIKPFHVYSSLTTLVPATEWSKFEKNTEEKNGKWAFVAKPAINGLALGSVEAYEEVEATTLLSTKVTTLAKDVNIAGVRSYAAAYEFVNNGFIYGLGNLSGHSSTITELTANDLTKGAGALAQLGKDITKGQTTYDADVTTFEAAVKAYIKDADAYGADLQLTESQEGIVQTAWDKYIVANNAYNAAVAANPEVSAKKTAYESKKLAYENLQKDMDATQQQIKDAKKAMDDAEKEYNDAAKALATPAANLTAAITNLKTKLAAYYPLRKNLCGDTDDFVATVAGINEGKEFKLADKISTLTEAQFQSTMESLGYNSVRVYGVTFTLVASDKKGSLQGWHNASKNLYGLNKPNEKIVIDLATIQPNMSVVVNLKQMGSATTLVTLKAAKDAFSNLDSWNTLAATIEGIATTTSTTEAPIVAEIKKLAAAIGAVYEPYRETFYALCALDITMFNDRDLKDVKEVLNITEQPNTQGEKQTLSELKDALVAHKNDNSVTIYIPVYTNDQLAESTAITTIALTESALSNAVDVIEKNIGHLEVYVAAKKDQLKQLEDGTLEIVDFITKEKVKVENDIAFKEEQIKNAQERFDALNKAKDALIKEFSGTEK